MNMFVDAEFTGLHKNTTLVSIGFIAGDHGKHSFYAEFIDYDDSQCDDWIRNHVLNNLLFTELEPFKSHDIHIPEYIMKGTKAEISEALCKWFTQFQKIEFWGDSVAYDWILLVDLIGMGKQMRKMPKNFYNYQAFDIFTGLKVKGLQAKQNRHELLGLAPNPNQHNSRYDADITRQVYNKYIK